MVADLVRAAHAGPSLVVTMVVLGLGLAADLPARRLALLAAAVLAGQVTVGWVNDLVDADRDRRAARSDKPLARPGSLLTPRMVRVAAGVALATTVVSSLALGPVPGLLHLLGVAAGLAYDLGVKATPASPLPYALAFGLLPVVAVSARGDEAGTAWWAMVAGACFGVGVHLANVVPDLEADGATGVRGLPQRLGRTGALVAAVVVLVTGSAVVVVGSGAAGASLSVAALVLTGLVVAVAVAAGRGADELAYRLVLVLGLAVVATLLSTGGAIIADQPARAATATTTYSATNSRQMPA